MGIQLMGRTGLLLIANQEGYLTKEEILVCIYILENGGRYISNKLYHSLLRKLGL